MRFVFFLLFILCFYAPLFSQQPTKEQMQAQMKQAKQEAQQQIGELEAQIAEAKKNKEDPESIREAEDGTWMWCHQIKKRHSDHQSSGQSILDTQVLDEICQSDGCPTVSPQFLQQLNPMINQSIFKVNIALDI